MLHFSMPQNDTLNFVYDIGSRSPSGPIIKDCPLNVGIQTLYLEHDDHDVGVCRPAGDGKVIKLQH